MSESDKDMVAQTQDKLQDGYFADWNQDSDIHPNQLSGDENKSQSVLIGSTLRDSSKANFGLTISTIIKTVIGSGILSMPFAVCKMGWVFAVIIFLGAALMTMFGSILLLKAKNLSRHSNFSTIFYVIWKSKIAKSIASITIVLNNIGICIAQMIIFKQTINKLLGDVLGIESEAMTQFYTKPIFIVMVMSLLQSPLTLVKKMEKLKFMALAGVTGIVVFMITFAIFFIFSVLDDNPLNNPIGHMRMFPQDWFSAAAAVPNVVLALSFQMNFFPIFKGMRVASDARMAKAVLIALIFCTLSYLMIGIMGYEYVGEIKTANFLTYLLYDKVAKPFFFIINFGFLISIFFAFPIMFFGCRNNFIALIQLVALNKTQLQKNSGWREGDQIQHISSYIQQEGEEAKKSKANIHFILYTIGIYLVIVGVAMAVDDIEAVFNVIGSICSSSIGFLLPTFFYFKLVDKRKKARTIKYYVSIVIFAIMGPFAIFSVVAHYVKKSE